MSKSSKKYHSEKDQEQERKIFENYFGKESLHDVIKRVIAESFEKRKQENCLVIEKGKE